MDEVREEYNINLIFESEISKYDTIILAISHCEFLSLEIKALKYSNEAVVFEIKSFLDRYLIEYPL